MNTRTLNGKVAIVTGASRGIGAAIAAHFAEQGAQLAISARKLEGLNQVAAQLQAQGYKDVLPHACHSGKPDEVAGLVAAAIARFGRVDVLVNNAATNPYFGPLIDADFAVWDKTFDVNLKGYFAATREVVRHLIDRNAPGSIINIASVVGLRGSPLQGIYAMTKAAIISMTQTLAVELGGRNIRVNAIAPGIIETRFSKALTENDEIRSLLLSRTPMGRTGQPEELTAAAAFLASDAASFVTGHTLVIDGGMTANLA